MPEEHRRVENPPTGHVHRPRDVDGQQICQDCNAVVINPILSFDDERIRPMSDEELFEKVKAELSGCPADYIMLALGIHAPFITILTNAYQDDPPHTRTLRWWND